jgi:hypothetical protein
VSDFSFFVPKLLKIEVRRFSFRAGFASEVVPAGDSVAAPASVAVGDVTGSSAFASFFCYMDCQPQ